MLTFGQQLTTNPMGLNKEDIEFFDKIKNGLQLAVDRLYDQKAANNELAVVSINGEIKWIDAKDVVNARKNKK
jgi:hypothetical protein